MTVSSIREAAEANLETFIALVAPQRVLGQCHRDLIHWWTRPEAKDHQLVLFPRDHGKSALVAYRVAWELAKDPTLRILYISATANLAQKQLGFIKQILDSKVFAKYWPEHLHKEEGRRSKWTNSEIELDHPLRKIEQIRDPSIMTAGLTTGITGMHFDIAVLDDVVVYENAYTLEGRTKVQTQYSLLASIEGTGSSEWVVGTRYHPNDLYGQMLTMREPTFDKYGDPLGEEPIYEVLERQVEDAGDGTGEYLWPKQQRKDGKWFGFDMRELARKKAKYLDRSQFRAQYYNDPTDPDNRPIEYDEFQYYKKERLTLDGGTWLIEGKRLNIIASVDFAFSMNKESDYTAVVVAGVDNDNNFYVLDIKRFKTDRIVEYFKEILAMYNKWGFKKLVAETNVAQQAIVRALKEDYIAAHGLSLKVIEVKPTHAQGSKQERINAILMPRYENNQIFHYRGGNTQVLEEELVSHNPAHDDIKDALANAIDNLVKPMAQRVMQKARATFHDRFGGRL